MKYLKGGHMLSSDIWAIHALMDLYERLWCPGKEDTILDADELNAEFDDLMADLHREEGKNE